MKDLTELRKIAEQATPGPWEPYDANEGMDRAYSPMWCVANEEFHNPTAGDDEDWMGVEIHVGDKADSDHIATFDPPTVLALITRLEQAEQAVQRVRELAEAWKSRGEHDMEYSKTIPPDIGEIINEGGAEMVHKANLIYRALDGDTRG